MAPPSNVCHPELLKLAAAPSKASLRRLWRAMTSEERAEALESLLAGEARGPARSRLAAEIAPARHFRPKTLKSMSDAELASMGARIELRNADFIDDALISLHVRNRRPMLVRFAETAEIPHVEGEFRDGAPAEPVPAERLVPAADALLDEFEPNQVLVYLLAIFVMYPKAFGHLDAWLVATSARIGAPQPASSAFVDDTRLRSVHAPTDTIGFTTLDRRTIAALVECAAGVMGAASRREMDDLVLELVDLNASRHQTFFHLGFRDALFERTAADSLPAENVSRRRWYWAGYVNGLARVDSWTSIAELFDEYQAIRTLGNAWDGASQSGAWLVFKALCTVGRYAEAGAFVKPVVIAESSQLRGEIRTAAIDLIRRSRAAEALPMLDSLEKALESIEELDEEDEAMLVEVRRRRAICLRQTGDVEGAMRLLGALSEVPDEYLNAIVRSDMGLIRARAQRLGDLVIPAAKTDVAEFIERLSAAESDFLAAVSRPSFRPAHANFALGVLRLAQGKHGEAVTRLDEALAYFSTEPDVYRRDGTLPSARLYLGIAICQALTDTGRFPRACELIREGLSDGATFTLWLLTTTLDHLALGQSELAQNAAASILELAGDGALDALLSSSAAEQSPAIRAALFARAADPSRPASLRVRDYRTALPWLLANRETSHSEDALSYLEEQAVDGIGRDEFLEVLERPESLSPAWSMERAREARMRLLEADGRFEDAAAVGSEICYRLLASSDDSDLDAAALLVQHLEGYGPAGSSIVSSLSPVIEARCRQLGDDADSAGDAESAATPVTILIVGGNEQHARMDQSLHEKCAESCPGVTVEFLHTGWSGNWAAYAEEFERRSARADGVVMLELMRTMLGRTIRGQCAVPWRGCHGRGQGAILNAVRRVVPMARRHLAERVARQGV